MKIIKCSKNRKLLTYAWKPAENEDYFFLEDGNNICSEKWEGSYIDYERFYIGNVFKTGDEVEFKIERLKVLTKLRRLA